MSTRDKNPDSQSTRQSQEPSADQEGETTVIVDALVKALRRAQEVDSHLARARRVSPQALKRPIGI